MIIASFVHGYQNLDYKPELDTYPSLWACGEHEPGVYSYIFPRNVDDFHDNKSLICGEMPLETAKNFERLPRFGLTGLSQTKNHIYAGSWNGVYQINKSNYKLEKIITHRLMNDQHGIYADEEKIITILTGKDLIVITNHNGDILDSFSIQNDLTLVRDDSVMEQDWRFISKQFRGSTGRWHFNYVQELDGEIWLTSRNTNCFVVINKDRTRAWLRTINFKTPVLLHDGVRIDNTFYFTSIDGKIIMAQEAQEADFEFRESFDDVSLFDRDLVSKVIRIEETPLGREPNWCRGIAVQDDNIYVTIDGRYDTDLSFGILGLDKDTNIIMNERLKWEDVGDTKELRFVSGFDLITY